MKTKKTFISKKYRSMLLGGSITVILASVMIMADTLIAGSMLGEKAAAAVNLVYPAYFLANFFATVFSLGTPILYSNELGGFHKKEADRTFGTGLLVTVATGAALFLLLLFGGDLYLHSFQSGETTLFFAGEYLLWMKYTVFLMPVNELLCGMVYADGDVTISTVSNLVSGIGNILLSILLCKSIGMQGLGLASFLSLAVSTAILFLHFVRKGNSLRLNLAFSAVIVLNIVKYSIVDACTYLFFSVFTALMNRYVAKSFGTELIILVSVITLFKEAQLFFDGIGEAITPIMSMYLGEETWPGIRKIWRLAGRTALIESLVVMVLLILGAPLVIRFLGIEDPSPVFYGTWGLRMMALTLVFTCRMYLDSSYYILIDKISLGVLVCALRDLIVPLPLAMLGGVIGGVFGMFAGLTAAPVIGYILSCLYVKIRYGKENYALFLADREYRKKAGLYELEVTPEHIVQTRDRIGEMLAENDYPQRTVSLTMLLFEELFMTIYEQNERKTVLAECSVELGVHVRIITRDDGEIFDLTDPDRKVESLRGYIVSNLTEHLTDRKAHFTTLSYNRNVFEI